MKFPLNKLLLLNDLLVEQAQGSTIQSINPIKPISAPITATVSWKHEDGFLSKIFNFDTIELRNRFLTNVISYEEIKYHYAKIVIDGLKIGIKITTKNLNKVTELDKEYAKALDSFEKQIKIND